MPNPRLAHWLSHDFFLDWSLKNWQDIYKNQSDLLEIHDGRSSRLLPQVIAFDNTDERLSIEQVRFRLASEPFQIQFPLEAEKLLSLYKRFSWFHNRKLFDDICLRLVSAKLYHSDSHQKFVSFQLQKTSYFDYICTNLCLDARTAQTEKSLRTTIHIEQNNHQLELLERSFLANVLGINILAFTADGTLILQKRSSRTLVRPGQLCASASGTLTETDIPCFDQEFTLEQLLPLFFRELTEEIGLDHSTIPSNGVNFLGIVRELIRGGQPELLLSVQIEMNKTQVIEAYRHALDRFESRDLLFFDFGLTAIEALDSEEKKFQFLLKFAELIQKYEQEISDPLWAILALWWKLKLDQ